MNWEIHGYAIISDNDCIADQHGQMPDSLKNDADWQYFQRELDQSVLSVIGRHSHAAAPNQKDRRRVVASTRLAGLTKDDRVWWWNPMDLSIIEMLEVLAPDGGRIAVPGGRQVFDMILVYGFDGFHLARKNGLDLPDGVSIFSAVTDGNSAENCLAASGLRQASSEILDSDDNVSMTIWRR